MNSLARLILVIFLVLLIIGMLPMWPYSTNWGLGWYPSGGLGVLVIIIVVLAVLSGGNDRSLPKG